MHFLAAVYSSRVFVAAHGLSFSQFYCAGFSLQWILLLQSTGSRLRASVVLAHSPAAPQPAESFWTRDGLCVLCTGMWILIHSATREVLELTAFNFPFPSSPSAPHLEKLKRNPRCSLQGLSSHSSFCQHMGTQFYPQMATKTTTSLPFLSSQAIFGTTQD